MEGAANTSGVGKPFCKKNQLEAVIAAILASISKPQTFLQKESA